MRKSKREVNPNLIQVAAPLDDFYEALHRFGMLLLVYIPILLLCAAGGGYWLSRRALAPFGQIYSDGRERQYSKSVEPAYCATNPRCVAALVRNIQRHAGTPGSRVQENYAIYSRHVSRIAHTSRSDAHESKTFAA